MSKDQSSNPWTDREKKRQETNESAQEEHDLAAKAGEDLHQGDEELDQELADEVEELEASETAHEGEKTVNKQLQEAHERVLRAQAEIDNVRRRAEQDVAKAHKFANEKLLTELLPILDSLEQALQNKTEDNAFVEGVELTYKMFLDVLGKFKVKQIQAEGQKFDPQLHEAMTMQENKEYQANTVIAVIQNGYTLNDRLIRPARVIVSK